MEPCGGTVAITGANGFLGRHLVRAAIERGWAVRAVVRSEASAAFCAGMGAQARLADLTQPSALQQAFEGVDAVISNAALFTLRKTPWERYETTNIEGTRHVLEAAQQAGVRRVIHISSTAVYRTRAGAFLREDAPQLTRSDRWWARHYSLSKALSEQLAWQCAERLSLDLSVLRPCAIYGSGDTIHAQILARAARLAFLPLPDLGFPFVHADDVAQSAILALSRPQTTGKAYNLASDPVGIASLVRAWCDVRGLRGPVVWALPGRALVTYDTTAARRELDFQPVDLIDGLREAAGVKEPVRG